MHVNHMQTIIQEMNADSYHAVNVITPSLCRQQSCSLKLVLAWMLLPGRLCLPSHRSWTLSRSLSLQLLARQSVLAGMHADLWARGGTTALMMRKMYKTKSHARLRQLTVRISLVAASRHTITFSMLDVSR